MGLTKAVQAGICLILPFHAWAAIAERKSLFPAGHAGKSSVRQMPAHACMGCVKAVQQLAQAFRLPQERFLLLC